MSAIEPKALLTHYRRILKVSPMEIFYVGSAQPETVAALLQPMLAKLSRDVVPMVPQTGFQTCEETNVVQTMDVSQGKLCMGFITPITNRSPEFPAMQLMNTILGAGMTSKLFVNVREKMSLCYSIGSGYYGSKGIVTVSAGIDFDKEDLVKEEVLRQLDACRDGNITEAELNAAREALVSSLRSTNDSPGAIEGYYATAALSGLKMTPEQYIARLWDVTLEDVVSAARQLSLHSTYFLKGEDQ